MSKNWEILKEIANLSLECKQGKLKEYVLESIGSKLMKDLKEKILARIEEESLSAI